MPTAMETEPTKADPYKRQVFTIFSYSQEASLQCRVDTASCLNILTFVRTYRSRAQSIESKEEPSLQDFGELKLAVQNYHAQRGELTAEDYEDIRRKALHLQQCGMLTRDMVQKAHDLIDDGDGYVVFAIDKYHDFPEALQLYLYYKKTRKQAKESALARIDEKIRRKTLEIRESVSLVRVWKEICGLCPPHNY